MKIGRGKGARRRLASRLLPPPTDAPSPPARSLGHGQRRPGQRRHRQAGLRRCRGVRPGVHWVGVCIGLGCALGWGVQCWWVVHWVGVCSAGGLCECTTPWSAPRCALGWGFAVLVGSWQWGLCKWSAPRCAVCAVAVVAGLRSCRVAQGVQGAAAPWGVPHTNVPPHPSPSPPTRQPPAPAHRCAAAVQGAG